MKGIDKMPKIALTILSILVVIVLLVLVVSLIANMTFNQKVKKEVSNFFDYSMENNTKIITESDIRGLPPSVQKWLKSSQVLGKEKINSVRLKQKATMRLKEDKPWMPAEAEQYFKIDEPGFIWKADIKIAPLFNIVGRDMYYDGRGNMLIKLLAFIPISDARGKEIDQGTLLRYLAETVWFPTAALSSYIKWEEIDSNSAMATLSYKGVSASGVFSFNEKGRL